MKIKNRARCKKCGDIVESKYRHDFVTCTCGAISVDGGNDYLRRRGNPEDYENMNDADGSKVTAFCNEYDSKILLVDGFEEAFLGVGNAFRDEPVAVYDRNKCIDMLAKDFKRHADYNITEQKTWDDHEETDFYEQAMEYFDYNVQGAYVGDKTPIFITLIETN